jgi:hypothetical protein
LGEKNMSETKFTKGDWVQRYCNLVKIGEVEWEFDSCADASLVAAAPEMYAMLELDLADLVYELKYCEPVYEHQIEKLKAKINQKTKLLAKARGESC